MSQSSPKIKVAKQGEVLGEFSLWEIKQKLDAKEFFLNYNFWRPGMSMWGKLKDIDVEISNTTNPQGINNFSGSAEAPPPPPSTLNILISASCLVIGLACSVIGSCVLLSVFFPSMFDGVIQQNGGTINMNSGVLLIILGISIIIFGFMEKNNYLSFFNPMSHVNVYKSGAVYDIRNQNQLRAFISIINFNMIFCGFLVHNPTPASFVTNACGCGSCAAAIIPFIILNWWKEDKKKPSFSGIAVTLYICFIGGAVLFGNLNSGPAGAAKALGASLVGGIFILPPSIAVFYWDNLVTNTIFCSLVVLDILGFLWYCLQ
jgi:hypothetical protein